MTETKTIETEYGEVEFEVLSDDELSALLAEATETTIEEIENYD